MPEKRMLIEAEGADVAGTEKLIDLSRQGGLPNRLLRIAAPALESVLALGRINDCYDRIRENASGAGFWEKCLQALNVDGHISSKDLEKIPQSGSLIVVANHPFGAIEGIILGACLNRIRPDVKFLGNHLLEMIPDAASSIIPLNVFAGQAAVSANAGAYRRAVKWVKAGGVLITFPAGEVAHITWADRRIIDLPWQTHIASLVRLTGARVLPVYLPGRNSLAFNLLGLLHPRLRTLMLARELLAKSGRKLPLFIGRPIPASKLLRFANDQACTDYLRFHTFFLKNRVNRQKIVKWPLKTNRTAPLWQAPLIAPPDPVRLEADLSNLPAAQLLLQQNGFCVYWGLQRQMPHIMHEIGRLREISFRAVQEGTGKATDIDPYDAYYVHLFLWDKEAAKVIGAYRLGLVDRILDRFGPKGLYTSSLFRFKTQFFHRLQNAIELGRSFIRPEYQKKHHTLMLLWRGIGEYLCRQQTYRYLFGPVSISQNYRHLSKTLMVEFLRQNRMVDGLHKLVRPRKPFSPRTAKGLAGQGFGSLLTDFEDVSLLISEIEKDGKAVPVLMKHYLKLEGKFISFNVDRRFANVVDGLVMVDLLQTSPKILKRIMGTESMETYLANQRTLTRDIRITA